MIIPFFYLFVFLFAAIIHEVAHGAMAYKLGDPTAKDAGRLTLNPIKHIDPMGSIFLPAMLFVLRSPILFGWAKPVPFNPIFLKHPKRDSGLIALAGPVSNFIIAGIFYGMLVVSGAHAEMVAQPFPWQGGWFATINPILPGLLGVIVQVSLWLGVINLVPLPPLDGSKVLFMLLPKRWYGVEVFLEKNGPMLLMGLILILLFL